MRISDRDVGDVTVVDLAGKLTLTDSPGRIKEAIGRLVTAGRKHIVLNLADVTYVDSSGLGELVACHLTAERGGSAIKLANAGYRMQDLLVLTKLLTVFESHRSEAAAIQSFARNGVRQRSGDFPQALWSRIF